MKIDEATINHNVVRLIKEFELWEIRDTEEGNHARIMALGYISGIIDMAEALKEVSKA